MFLLLQSWYAASRLLDVNNQPQRLCDIAALRERRLQRDRRRFCDRRLVFTISTGRSGTHYLCELLATCDRVRAFHEARPKMNGVYLRQVQRAPAAQSRRSRRIKLAAINRQLAQMPADHVYVETNHMFIKTFADVVLDYYDRVEVIILRRRLDHVLRSCLQLGWFSNRNPIWKLWMPVPDARRTDGTTLTDPPGPADQLDPYDRCIAYLLEVEAQARRFKQDHPQVPCHEVTLEQISTERGARELFDALGLSWSDAAAQRVRRQINRRATWKRAINRDVSLASCRQRLDQYLARARQANRRIPPIEPNWH